MGKAKSGVWADSNRWDSGTTPTLYLAGQEWIIGWFRRKCSLEDSIQLFYFHDIFTEMYSLLNPINLTSGLDQTTKWSIPFKGWSLLKRVIMYFNLEIYFHWNIIHFCNPLNTNEFFHLVWYNHGWKFSGLFLNSGFLGWLFLWKFCLKMLN